MSNDLHTIGPEAFLKGEFYVRPGGRTDIVGFLRWCQKEGLGWSTCGLPIPILPNTDRGKYRIRSGSIFRVNPLPRGIMMHNFNKGFSRGMRQYLGLPVYPAQVLYTSQAEKLMQNHTVDIDQLIVILEAKS